MREARFALGVLAAGILVACGTGAPEPPGSPAAPATGRAEEWFVDRAHAWGLDFVHVNGMSGRWYMTEVLAPGAALLDYDNDGDLDVYLVQSGPLAPGAGNGLAADRPPDRLYRNDLTVRPDGSRSVHFTDVTGTSGIRAAGYGMGVAAGDYDNDGHVDLYLTKFDAPNQLLHNNGDGTFTDVSAASGTAHRAWSVSAAWVDVNRDGWLDLFVTNYLRYGLSTSRPCVSPAGASDYCTPDAYPPLPDRLYVNRRDGTFADATVSSGIAGEFGPGLGVVTADFNGDGWIDLYVTNDGQENLLWQNAGDGTFRNAALLSGVALPVTAKAEASMGVDAGDADGDGDDDLVMTELTGEGSNLFVNDGTGVFEDRSAASGIGPASLPYTGFGIGWLDVDNDGRLDVLSVNGTVQVIERLRQASDPYPLRQRRLLLRNVGGGRFEDVSDRAGAAFRTSDVGRGLALGDIDNDGDLDAFVATSNGPARLLVNEHATAHWLGLRLVGPGGRDVLGARVEVIRAGEPPLWRRAYTDGSYASSRDPRVLVGLGASAAPPTVRVIWPDGRRETFAAVPVDRYTTLRQGTGAA